MKKELYANLFPDGSKKGIHRPVTRSMRGITR